MELETFITIVGLIGFSHIALATLHKILGNLFPFIFGNQDQVNNALLKSIERRS